MLRTSREWIEELEALRRVKASVPEEVQSQGEPDGENYEGAIMAQMETIAALLTSSNIRDLYEGEEFLMDAALEAERWLRHDDTAPSELWREKLSTAA